MDTQRSQTILKSFLLQQNAYKSLCTSVVVDNSKLKFFTIIDFEKLENKTYLDDIIQGIEVSFKKIIKNETISEDSIEQLFEESLKDLNKFITELIHINQLPLDLSKFHCLIGIVCNDKLFFSQKGKFDGFIVYKSKNAQYKILNILKTVEQEEKKNPTTIFSNIITGDLKDNQVLFFTTSNLEKYLSLFTIKNILLDSYYIDELNATLKQTTNNDNFAAVYLKREPIKENAAQQIPIAQKLTQQETENTEHSISNLEKTRNKTQELLSPTIIKKFRNWINSNKKKQTNKKKNLLNNIYK